MFLYPPLSKRFHSFGSDGSHEVRMSIPLGSVQKLHHPGTREGGVSVKMILDYVGGGRGIAKDDG